MRFNKISSILEYVTWLLKKHSEQQQLQAGTVYRVASIKQLPLGQCKLIIQIIGKSTFIESTPQEVAADDYMLEKFSKKDIRVITYLACQQIKKPTYKIIMQEFCDRLNGMLFKLQKRDGDREIIIKTANQISLDKNLLHNLSKEDIHSIGYSAGYEHSSKKDSTYE